MHDLSKSLFQCNPPSLCPLTEIVPHPDTSPDVVRRTRDLMTEIGQSAVTLKKEIDGFALNRIQYSVINECWRLVLVTGLILSFFASSISKNWFLYRKVTCLLKI